MFNGKNHYKWSFSIAMLNYQRVATFVPQQWIRVPHHHIGDVDPSKTQGRMRSQKWLAADGPQNLWGRAPRTPNWSPGDWTGIGSHENGGDFCWFKVRYAPEKHHSTIIAMENGLFIDDIRWLSYSTYLCSCWIILFICFVDPGSPGPLLWQQHQTIGDAIHALRMIQDSSQVHCCCRLTSKARRRSTRVHWPLKKDMAN